MIFGGLFSLFATMDWTKSLDCGWVVRIWMSSAVFCCKEWFVFCFLSELYFAFLICLYYLNIIRTTDIVKNYVSLVWSLIVLATAFSGNVQLCIDWGNLKLHDVAPLDTGVVQDSTCFDYPARPLIMWHK